MSKTWLLIVQALSSAMQSAVWTAAMKKKKLICREHKLSPAEARAVDAMCTIFSRFVDDVGSARVAKCETLVRLVGRGVGDVVEEELVRFALLVDARMSPKVQFFAICHGTDSSTELVADAPYPYDICLSTCGPRLHGTREVVHLCTSDELAYWCASRRPSWQLQEMSYQMPCDVQTLMLMRVDGHSPPFAVAKAKAAANRSKPSIHEWLPPELDIDDPLLHRAPGFHLPSGDGPVWDAERGADWGDEGGLEADELLASFLEGLPEGLVEDVLLDAFEARPDAEGPEQDPDEDVVAEETPEPEPPEAASLVEALAEVGVPEAAATVPDVQALVLAGVAAATISSSGYVHCPEPPWCEQVVGHIGRVTTWPSSKPLAQRSVSCRCYAHPKCSFAKSRAAISDEELYSWLLSGLVDETVVGKPTPVERAAAHMSLGHRRAYPKPPEAAYAPGAASSSGA